VYKSTKIQNALFNGGRDTHESKKQYLASKIMNTSAPVKISDYIGNSLLNNSSNTPTHVNHSSDEKQVLKLKENTQPNLNKCQNLTSAVRIAQKLQEYNRGSKLSKSKCNFNSQYFDVCVFSSAYRVFVSTNAVQLSQV